MPPDDVVSVGYDRRLGQLQDRLRIGQGTFILDNNQAQYSVGTNPKMQPDRAISLKATGYDLRNPVNETLDVTTFSSPTTFVGRFGGIIYASGAVGPSALRSTGGIDDVIQVNSPVQPSGPFTWEALIKPVPGNPRVEHIIFSGTGSGDGFGGQPEVHISVNSTNKLTVAGVNSATTVVFRIDDAGPDIRDNELRHVALALSGQNSGDLARLYLDGDLIATDQLVAALDADILPLLSLFGAPGSAQQAQDRRYTGSIEQFRVWDYERSQAQIDGSKYDTVSAVSSGLLHYLPMFDSDPASLVIAKDKSPNAYHASVANVHLAPGLRGDFAVRAVNGENPTVVASAFFDTSTLQPWTIMCRASPVTSPLISDAFVINNEGGSSGSRTGFSLQWRRANQRWRLERSSSGLFVNVEGDGISEGNQHVAGTFTGSYIGLFIDGTAVGSTADTRAISSSLTNLFMGGTQFGGNRSFDGVFDDVAVFDYALSQEQVQQAVNSGPLSVVGSPPIGHWDFEDGGSDLSLFTGRIDEIDVGAPLGRRETSIRASERTKQFKGVVNLPIILDTIVQSIAAEIVSQDPVLRDYAEVDEILDEAPYAALNEVPIGEAVNDVILSGDHTVHVDGRGILRIKNRNFSTFQVPCCYFTNEGLGLTYQVSDERIVNDARVFSQAREEVSLIQTVSFLNDRPELVSSAQISFNLQYRDPVTNELNVPVFNLVTPVASQDYLFNTSNLGSGTDITTFLKLELQPFATSARVNLTNVGTLAGFVIKLQLRGQPLRQIPPFLSIRVDTPSIAQFGRKTLQLDNRIPISFAFNENYSEFLIAQRSQPIPIINFTVRNDFANQINRDLLQTISVVESHTGVNSWYTIAGIVDQIVPAGPVSHTSRYDLRLARPTNFLVLDDDPFGRLDSDRVLGF